MNVLAGDIGGTKTVLAVFAATDSRLVLEAEQVYPSREYAALEDIVGEFLATRAMAVDAAGFGIAGPVDGRSARTTNLPWTVDADLLERARGIPRVRLLNDLEATAYGIYELPAEDLRELVPGQAAPGANAGVIAAGTGLGEAGIYRDGGLPRPFATEGGHGGFGPEDDVQHALWAFMAARYGRVSWERVLAGPAIPELLEFLAARDGVPIPDALRPAVAARDAAPISIAADAGTCPLCARTLELFVTLYGSEAGNLALRLMARGGIYLGGGIAPKIAPWLARPAFREAFLAKGRMRGVLETIPVRLILNNRAALLGAARCAALP